MLRRPSSSKAGLRGATVVITGASSCIGRAAALDFVGRGANVVVAARREGPLQSLADACERRGGRALAVPTDTADEAQVEALARRAVERFGRLDVWVNNAAVYLAASSSRGAGTLTGTEPPPWARGWREQASLGAVSSAFALSTAWLDDRLAGRR